MPLLQEKIMHSICGSLYSIMCWESITNSKEVMPLYFYLQLLQTLGLHQDKSPFPRLIVGYRAPQLVSLTMRLLGKEMRLSLLILTYRLPHLGLWTDLLLKRGLSSLTMTVSYHSLIHRFLSGRDSGAWESGYGYYYCEYCM